jgi:hypothetical protein
MQGSGVRGLSFKNVEAPFDILCDPLPHLSLLERTCIIIHKRRSNIRRLESQFSALFMRCAFLRTAAGFYARAGREGESAKGPHLPTCRSLLRRGPVGRPPSLLYSSFSRHPPPHITHLWDGYRLHGPRTAWVGSPRHPRTCHEGNRTRWPCCC